MTELKHIVKKTFATLREDGVAKTGEKAKLYLKRRKESHREDQCAEGLLRDVLFINGCNEQLPHPGRYRVTHQREQLEALGMTTGEIYFARLSKETVRCYRTFIFFRCPCTEVIEEFVMLAKQLNKTVLYDIDDLVIDTVFTSTIQYLDNLDEQERRAYDENVRSMGRLCRMCDGAVTTTAALALALEEYVPSVLINRNTASEEMAALSLQAKKKREQEKRTDETVRLGYFSGSITHNEDVQMILPILSYVLDEYPNTELHLVGELDLPKELEQYAERIKTHPFGDWRRLPELIAQVDINLAPLKNTLFNHAKSEIKWIEAALVGIPTVASDLGAFHEMVDNGVTGILCKEEHEWAQALDALIRQPEYRRLIGEQAFAYCMHHCVTGETGQVLYQYIREHERENAAFILPAFQISGGVMVALQHAAFLQKAGNDVLLLSIDETGRESWYEFDGCLFPVLNLNECRMEGRIDRAVATMWSTVSWLDRLGHTGRRFYLVQNEENEFYEHGDPLRLQARATYGLHDELIYLTISGWCREWLKTKYGHEARYIPNGMDTERFRKDDRVFAENGRIRILIEGDSSAAHKRVDESFRITNRLDRETYEIWYLSYHGEPKDWYHTDRVLSRVPYEQVHEVYQSCDILLKSSILESFSYPPLEMMASGGLVVAVRNEGNSEYLSAEQNALVYETGDEESAAEAILRLSEDEELRERLAENGRKTAERYDWSIIRSQINDFYLVGEGSRL